MPKQPEFQTVDEMMTLLMITAKESPTYQRIAIYIEKNYLRIIFMTASELAEKMRVSQGSVSRFFMALGYNGYNGFLHNLQQLVSQQLTAPQRLQYSQPRQQPATPLQNILQTEQANMDELTGIMQGESYQKILAMIVSPKPLILISSRMSATLLPYTAYILQKMRPQVSIVTPEKAEWELLDLARPADVNVLAIAFPRYPNNLLKKCKALHEKHVPLGVLTDSKLSPIVSFADAAVFVSVTTTSLFDCYSTPMMFLNLMLRDAASKLPHIEERIAKIEEIEHVNNVYFTK